MKGKWRSVLHTEVRISFQRDLGLNSDNTHKPFVSIIKVSSC